MSKFIKLGLLLTVMMVGIIACNPGGGGDGDGFKVTVTSSSLNVETASSITLTAKATGGNLKSVQFLKGDENLGDLDTASPFETTVALTSADNGTIKFSAKGTDDTDKTDTSDEVTVTVDILADVTPPTVSLVTSSANVTTAGTIDLIATATDNVKVDRVEFFKNGNRIGQLFAEPFTFQAFITQDDNGPVNFTAKAFDAAKLSADSNSVPVTVSISVATLLRPSKSSAIAISGNDKYILQVNPENDTLTIFRSVNNEKLAEVEVGEEPSAVVVHPDDISAFVAVRGEAKVVKIDDINTASASVDGEVDVGSEPTGIALSPSGKFLVVAEFAESRISIIDTDTMTIVGERDIRNPRAVAITNDGDTEDSDEKVVVTEFYGEINPGNVEGQNNSRTGVVRIFSLTPALSELEKVSFAPLATPDFAPTNETSPNQLYSVIITPDNSKFIALATAASPNGVASFNQNIYQLLLIGDIATGNVLSTINISAAIKTQVTGTKNFMGDIVDLSLVGNNIIYLASRAGDAFQRAVLSSDNQSVTLGSPFNKQVDLLVPKGCQAPIGVVTAHDVSDNKTMYFNCWMSRTMAAVDLASQSVIDDFAAATAPSGLELEINKGRRFYFTGRARWANESWSSCASCHPDGLSDNITWQFPAGPRQATSMDGTYSKGAVQKMRILNWSGIFDELHDFERNTRGVSGGLGAITTGNPCGGDLSGEKRTSLNPAEPNGAAEDDPNGLKTTLGIPVKEIQDTTANCVPDWDEIDLFVKTIRPPLGKRFASASSVDAGRDLFDDGNCAACHGGAGWTLSRRFFTPSSATNASLATTAFTDLPIGGDNPHPTQIGVEPDGATGIGPAQVSCVLRNVGTFGVPGDIAATAILEVKGVPAAPFKAQGEFAGYNIPSLYGLQVGAPFMHHGQASTLEEFLDPVGAWQDHLNAGNAVFGATLSAADVEDLANFLLSIDADTAEFVVPAGSEECPASF